MINPEYFWRIIFLLGIGTFTIRFSIIALSSKVKISDRVKEVFSFIPAAVLPALIAPLVFYHKGSVELIFGKERFIILILATIVCYYSRSMMLTIVFGLFALFGVTNI